MHKRLAIFILLLPVFASAQIDPAITRLLDDKSTVFVDSSILLTDEKNVTNILGSHSGIWRMKDENGRTLSMAEYVNGKLHGHLISFHSNGQIAHSQYYTNGVMNGPWVYFWKNGSPITSGFYKNGNLDGAVRDFDSLGNLIKIVEYKNGNPEGIELMLYRSGNIKVTTHYSNGKENGVRKEYFDNEKLELKGEFEMKDGVPVVGKFYENGKFVREHVYNYQEEVQKKESLRKQVGDNHLRNYKELLSD